MAKIQNKIDLSKCKDLKNANVYKKRDATISCISKTLNMIF